MLLKRENEPGNLANDIDRMVTLLEEKTADVTRINVVYRIAHRSGEWRWVDERGIGVRKDGMLLYVVGCLF